MDRFFKNLSANSVGILINLVAQLFSVPLFLYHWNKELYGEWLVLTAVPNLLWSLEGGLGVLAASRMTLAAAAKDWHGANEIFQTTLLSQIVLSVLLFGATILLVTTTKVGVLFGFHVTTDADAALILTIMISYMLLGLFLSVYRAAYRASEAEARGAMLLNFWRATDLGIIITVLSLNGHPIRLAECMFAGIVTWIVIGFIDVSRTCRNVKFGFNFISGGRLYEMVIHGAPILTGQLTTALYMQGFPLVINRALGPAAVVTLTTVRTISRLGLLPMQTVAFSSSPQLSRSFASADRPLFARLLKVMAVCWLWSALALVAGLSLLGPWLLSVWTSGKLSVDHLTLFLFSLSMAFQGVWSCTMVILGSCNKHHLFNYAYFVVMLIELGVAFVVVRPLGFEVVPLIMVVGDGLVAAIGIAQCRIHIPYFEPHDLLCVFQPSYYSGLLQRVLSRGKIKPVET